MVQRPFRPEGPDLLHVYLLHPPGGLVAGDSLSTEARVRQRRAGAADDARRRPRSTARRPGAAPSRQVQRLAAEAGSTLEWLPAETIVFDGAEVALETVVHLEGDAAFIGWEMICFGRPALAERYTRGTCRQRFELWRDGRPLCLDRTFLQAGSADRLGALGPGRPARWPAPSWRARRPRCPWMCCAPLAPICPAEDLAAVTVLDGVLVGRYLGGSTERCRALFVAPLER